MPNHLCREGIYLDRVKRIWYLSPMRAAKVQASLRIRAVLPEPSLLAHTSSESRGTFRQKARSLAPLNGWACAVKVCHEGMLEDTDSLDGAHFMVDASRHRFWFLSLKFGVTVMILSFQTARYTRGNIRSRSGAVCYSACLFWMHFSMTKPHCSNFRMITAIFWGVRNFWILASLAKYFITIS